MSTVDNIQSSVAALVDQDQDTSNIATSDYSIRLQFMNDRERRWSETGRYQVLYREFNTMTSTSTGNATVSLPSDYRVEAGFPRIFVNGSLKEVQIIKPQQKQHFSSTDSYAYLMGDSSAGYSMVFHPAGENFASGASIFISYFGNPTSLASPANKVTCPNPQYLIVGVTADVFRQRGDARFQEYEAQAEKILANMLEFEMTQSEASYNDRVRPIEQTRHNYRWGD